MPTEITCPACGRLVDVEPIRGELPACPHCGQSLQTTLGPAPRPTSRLTAAPATPVTFTPRRSPWRSTAGVLAAVVILTTTAGIIGYRLQRAPAQRPAPTAAEADWERGHRAEIFQLKAEAEALVLTGDLKGGHERYRQLERLAGHAIRDPVLYDAMQNARDAQERIYSMLLTQQETSLGYYNPATERGPAIAPLAAAPATPTTPAAPDAPAAAVYAQPNVVAGPPSAVTPAPAPENAPVDSSPTAVAAPTGAPTVAPTAAVAPPDQSLDYRIGASTNLGVQFLLSHFKDGELDDANPNSSVMHQGLNALCVYALLHASEGGAAADPRLNIRGPFLPALIARMKAHPMQSDQNLAVAPVVYARSLRAAALAVYNRAEDRAALRADVAWLLKAAPDGAYTYSDQWVVGAAAIPSGADVPPPGNSPPSDNLRSTPGGPGTRRDDRDPNPPERRAAPVRAALLDTADARAAVILIDNGEVPWAPGRPLLMPPPPPSPAPQYQPLQSDTAAPSATPSAAPARPLRMIWDNSNSQYGLLGVRAGAEAGVEVPTKYWQAVQKHWLGCELADGQWNYRVDRPNGNLAMTCAGVASLLITHDYLDAPALGNRVGRPPYAPGLAAGIKWLESGDNLVNIITPETIYVGYNLYGIERCALASGFKYFGEHDWFTELAGQVLPNQAPDGAWRQGSDEQRAIIDTAYLVLFLSRGRHPVVMNKLRFDPFWDNRPRDLANLTKFTARELERPLNWQVVSLQRPWSDWMDAPILYIASHQAPKLTDEDYDKLRSFAEAGGLIFTHADGAARGFNDWAVEMARRLFPQYPLMDMPIDHELFSVNYRLKSPPKLKMVTNGPRLLLVHSPEDLSPAWQERNWKVKREAFNFGANLFLWAAGRGNFRNRLDSPYIAEPTTPAQAMIEVARLKYTGAWDPEPYAWTRFGRAFQGETNISVKTTTVELKDLTPNSYRLAVLTGTANAEFTDAEVTAARGFVESGGTLLIDACGGASEFTASLEQHLFARAFPNITSTPLPPDDPIFKSGNDATTPARLQLRPYAAVRLGTGDGLPIKQIRFGKGRVICSTMDLTTALLGTNSWGILGYTPASAQALVKYVVLNSSR